jgi:hypothetical protein
VRPEPPRGPILHVQRPDADFRRAKETFRPIHEDPKPLTPKPDPVARQTREEDPVLPVRFPVAFRAESVAFPVDFLIKSSRYKNPMIKFNLLNLLL